MQRRSPPTWVLAFVTLSGTLAMHMLVPALPLAAQSLGVDASTASLTITVYIAGLAAGQLIYGPLADCLGRRPVLIAGLVIYTAAGTVAAITSHFDVLLASRLLQAAGGCAGLLLCRAIVRDTNDIDASVGKLALLAAMAAFGPVLAPLVGAIVAAQLGWRSILIALAALGLWNLALVLKYVPETGTPSGKFSLRWTFAQYGTLVSNATFRQYAVGGCLASNSLFALIAAAPFIFTRQMQVPLETAGAYMSLTFSGYILGTLLSRRLIGRWPLNRLILASNAAGGVVALAALGMTLVWGPVPGSTVALMFIYCICSGACGPGAVVKVLSVDQRMVASASGLFGAMQMATGALLTVIATSGSNHLLTTVVVLASCALVTHVIFGRVMRSEA